MTAITATTTDTQIAVRAVASYYRDGAPPELCVRLVNVARHLAALPDGGWPETQQALRQARETFGELTHARARVIAEAARAMTAERDSLSRAAEDQRAAESSWHGHPVHDAGRTVYVARRIIDGSAEYLGGKHRRHFVSASAAVAAATKAA